MSPVRLSVPTKWVRLVCLFAFFAFVLSTLPAHRGATAQGARPRRTQGQPNSHNLTDLDKTYANAWFRGSTDKTAKISAVSTALQKERVEAVVITVRRNGFDPGEIRRPKGAFLLVVNNHSDIQELSLQLHRENGTREKNVIVTREKRRWRELLDLSPGRYVLKETNHPDWVCQITIDSK
jgi:hypothetical protein